MNCPDCKHRMIEVKKAFIEGKILEEYPRIEGREETITERRYYCKNCKKEWLYMVREKELFDLSQPEWDGQKFKYNPKTKLLEWQL